MYHVVKSYEEHIDRFDIVMDTIEKQGKQAPYSYIRVKPGVTVIPILEDGRILLLREYRHAIREWKYEFPSGMIDEGEEPETAAARELLEETGYTVKRMEEHGYVYPSFGSTTEKVYLFLAYCGEHKPVSTELLEEMETEIVSVEELERMMQSNEFAHGSGMAAWLRYRLKRGEYAG